MRVLVLSAGVVGVATAWFLTRAGHAVFPRVPRPAAETPWSGLRPMTHDGPPVLGPTPFE